MKNLLSIICVTVVLIVSVTVCFTVSAEETAKPIATDAGDVDGSGCLDVNDISMIQRYLAAYCMLSVHRLPEVDVNGDKQVTIDDVTSLQRSLAEFAD